MRYEESHPWLTFRYAAVPNMLWAKLGEAYSKNQHLAGIPLPPAMAEHLAGVVLTKGALATAAIEGNTLSEEEAEAIIREGKKLPPSQEYLEIEIRNVVEALTAIDESGRAGTGFELTEEWLKEQNLKVLRDLEHDEHVEPGQYTEEGLVVGGVYRAAPPADVPHLMGRFCEWLNEAFVKPSQDPDLPEDVRFYNAVFGALLGHLYFVWIHPFGDGNGRTARLLEVAILSHSGVVPWIASNLLSDHYNRTRSRYYSRLAAASKKNDVDGFVAYAVEGYVDMLREKIDFVKALQIQISWTNYVHECIRGEAVGSTRDRRRDLVLTMPVGKVVSKKEIRRLSPELAEQYAGHEDRMIQRDLNALEKLGLVRRARGGYEPCAFIMNAFIPIPT